MRIIWGALAAGAIALGPGAATGAGAPATVDMLNLWFSPDDVTILNGESVLWTNSDPVTHTVELSFASSGSVAGGETFSLVFDDPGNFDYFCALHPGMNGIVRVQAVPGAPTAVATATPSSALRGRPITFDGTGSTAGTGAIDTWTWDFGGTTKSGPTLQHAFDRAGRHDVVLTVEDEDGQTDRTHLSVQVTLPALRVADAGVREGNRGRATLRFVVRLSAAVTYPVSVRYATRGGTAKAPGDFAGRSGTLAFEAGATRRVVAVPVKGDRKIEPHERLTLVLSGATGARIADGTAVGTIRNDDG